MSLPALRTLRLAAVNIDGVLLNDSFSPVIHRFVVGRGLAYTSEVEQMFFSRSRLTAARMFVEMTGGTATEEEVIEAYFAERQAYLRAHPVQVADGAVALLHRLRALGLDVVCYGGLDEGHFDRHLGPWSACFTEPRYICTDGFRPGIQEIIGRFGLTGRQVLFIDDVATFAERARELDVPFIGHPSPFPHGFQRTLMREAGVRHLTRTLSAIDEPMVRALDRDAANGTVWRRADGSEAGGVPVVSEVLS